MLVEVIFMDPRGGRDFVLAKEIRKSVERQQAGEWGEPFIGFVYSCLEDDLLLFFFDFADVAVLLCWGSGEDVSHFVS